MYTQAYKTQKNNDPSMAASNSHLRRGVDSTFQLVDNRQESVAQSKLQEMANNSPQVKQLAQFRATADNYSTQQQRPIQKKENNTGLPDNLKTGIENLSGMSLDDVKVHRNSNKPAQLQAHAYAQGTDIHLGSGQEKHLPHEAWHVVQQKQGRVSPTLQMKGSVNVNDDVRLEKEADLMGAKALKSTSLEKDKNAPHESVKKTNEPIQMVKGISEEQLKEAKHFAKHRDGHLELPKDVHGLPIPSKQSEAFNAVWNNPDMDQQSKTKAIRKQIASVGAKLDNRQARADQAKEDQKKRSKGWYKFKKGLYKGGARTLGGLGGAAGGALAGAPLGPGALGTAAAGGAAGGAIAGAAAGMTWNTGEKGTDLVAAGRERELASAAGFMARNGKSSQKAAARETGKDIVLGAFSGGLAPVIGVGGDAIGAIAGEGGGGVAAEAFSSSAMSAVSKEAADLTYDKATGSNDTTLKQRGINMLTGTLIGAATGAADELDASDTASNDAGIDLANDGTVDLHQWEGQGGEAASDMGYGVGQEGLGGAVERGAGSMGQNATSGSLHQVVRAASIQSRVDKAKNKFLSLKGEWEDTSNPDIKRWSKEMSGHWWFYDTADNKWISYDSSTDAYTYY